MSIKQVHGSLTAISCTLAGLADGSARCAASVSNIAAGYIDMEIQLSVKLATGTPSGEKRIYVYLATSIDNGSFDGEATGTNAAITLRAPTGLMSLEPMECPDAGNLTYTKTWRIAQLLGGIVPAYWCIVVENHTGLAFDGTEGNHTKQYRGITGSNS